MEVELGLLMDHRKLLRAESGELQPKEDILGETNRQA
jgi:hypothetical protein